jgi:hypothetical protein
VCCSCQSCTAPATGESGGPATQANTSEQAELGKGFGSQSQGRQQDWFLKCLQDGRANPLAACGDALCSPRLETSRVFAAEGSPLFDGVSARRCELGGAHSYISCVIHNTARLRYAPSHQGVEEDWLRPSPERKDSKSESDTLDTLMSHTSVPTIQQTRVYYANPRFDGERTWRAGGGLRSVPGRVRPNSDKAGHVTPP